MRSGIKAGLEDRYRDRFIRETARRIRFLLAAARRHPEAAQFIDDLRRWLDEASSPPDRQGSDGGRPRPE